MRRKKKVQRHKAVAAPSGAVRLGHTVLRREDEVHLLYRELQVIADKLGIDDVRLLDKNKVLDLIEGDPEHPLRALGYDWDDASAARKQRVVHTGQLITGLRVYTTSGPGKKLDAAPVYYFADNLVTATGELRRGHVHRDQLSKHDPSFVSVVHKQIEQLKLASLRLGHILRCNGTRRETWGSPWELQDAVMAALDEFEAQRSDKAAE